MIPVISGADTLSVEELAAAKEKVERDLAAAGIKPLTLSTTAISDTCLAVYAVSSAPYSEYDLADQKLDVSGSFEYMQPLATTDLGKLVDDILCPDGASWMRHTAASKYLQWRGKYLYLQKDSMASPQQSDLSLTLRPSLSRDVAARQQSAGPYWSDGACFGEDDRGGWSWALRRSLANNGRATRDRGGPVLSLTPEQCSDLGVYQPSPPVAGKTSRSSSRRQLARRNVGTKLTRRQAGICPTRQDPLGLLGVCGSIKCDGQVALELIGTFGILGTFGLWVWKGF